MPLFSVPALDKSFEEGTVVQVDPVSYICKVRTIRGRLLNDVQWLLPSGGSTRGADRLTPLMGDRVVITAGLGYPVILGFLPRQQSLATSFPLNISSDSVISNTGTYGYGSSIVGDQNKPRDIVAGDRLISSIGAAMIGLLRGGSVLIRANRGSEIFMSNFLNLVRVVSRNWTHISDVFTDMARNFKGRIYRYTGYSKDFLKAKNEDYNLHIYHGDVAAAEAVKTNVVNYVGTPATDSVILKEQITDETTPSLELMHRTLTSSGDHEVKVSNASHFTRVKETSESIELTWNSANTVTINGSSITIHHTDGDIVMNSSGITLTSHGHQVAITAGGVAIS